VESRNISQHSKALSTLATIVAEFGDNLSPNSATVAVFGDSRRNGDYNCQCGQGLTLPIFHSVIQSLVYFRQQCP